MMDLGILGERAWIDRTRYGMDGVEAGDTVSNRYVEHKRPWDDNLDDYLEIILLNGVYGRDSYGREMLSEANFEAWKADEHLMAHSVIVSWLNVEQMALIVRESYEDEDGEDWVTPTLESFADYPVLDEERYSDMEIESVHEAWSVTGWEMGELVGTYLGDEWEDADLGRVREAMAEWEGLYSPEYGFEDGGPSYSRAQFEEVAELVRKNYAR